MSRGPSGGGPDHGNVYPQLSPFSTGLACRCPRCGTGPLFQGYLTVRQACETCGLDLSAEDSGDGPAIFIIFMLGAVVVPMALSIEAALEPPLWVHAILWSTVILGGTLGLLRPFKAVMVALQFRHRPPGQ